MADDLRDAVLDLMTDLHVSMSRQDAAEAVGWVATTVDPECDDRVTQVVGVFATEIEAATWLDAHLIRANTGNGPNEKPFAGAVHPVMPVDP